MINEILKGTFAGHKVLFGTNLFGRNYFWMQDPEGVVYLARNTEGKPDFS